MDLTQAFPNVLYQLSEHMHILHVFHFFHRTLLKFESYTHNWGTCPFLPNLRREEWIYHDCHRHYHSFEAFVDFNLVDPTTGEKVAEGHKASFCLEDTTCADGYSPHYRCTPESEQGISANCGDRYGRYLDCQWIDITGLSSGVYLLSQHLNPHRDSPESDFRNNEITCKVGLDIDELTVNVLDCWQSGVYIILYYSSYIIYSSHVTVLF